VLLPRIDDVDQCLNRKRRILAPDGSSEAPMLAHGFTIAAGGPRDHGFSTATAQRIRAGGKMMEVATLRITEAGRRALGKA
jgi:hypothetical protein